MFGFPDEDQWPPPFNDDKWEDLTNFLFKYLGYLIDTRKMIMIWPLEKRHQLACWLDEHWLAPGIHSFSPLEASRLIGLLHHGGIISPLGIYLSLQVQYIINDYLSNHQFATWGKLRRWWNTHKFPMLSEIQSELCILHHTIDDNIYHPVWCHSISLIIQCEPTLIAKSDAAYEGIRGILDHLDCMWHVSGDDLWQLGWVLYGDEQELQQPLSDQEFTGYLLAQEGIHINLLEFVTIFINVWMTLKRIAHLYPDYQWMTFIAKFLADNTSAVSWLKYAGRSNKLPIRNLAHLLTTLLIHLCQFPIQVTGEHIPGEKNDITNALSRFSRHPSWGSLIADQSLNLCNIQAYQILRQLLTIIWSVASCQKIVDTSEQLIQRLWRLELQPLPHGWQKWTSTTSLY